MKEGGSSAAVDMDYEMVSWFCFHSGCVYKSGRSCFTHMVNRAKTDNNNNKQGKKKKESRETWKQKSSSSLVQAYVRVDRASKQIQRLQASMSHMIHREIMEGLSSKENMFNSSRPCFFANNVVMAMNVEQKKIEKKMVPFDGNLKHLYYNFRAGIVGNELNEETNLFEPDLLGRKMHPESVTAYETEDYGPGNLINFKIMTDIMKADIENKHTHRYLSLICRKSNVIRTHVEDYLLKLRVIHQQRTQADADLVNYLCLHIASIVKKESALKHYHKSHDMIKTADYVIHTFDTEHQYICKNDSYGWKIHKKNVIASYINSDNPVHIPVCEELILQYQIRDESNKKNYPVLINAEKCLVISCAIESSFSDHSPFASLHFFGDNAFSVVLGADNSKNIIQDRTKLCARLVGKLCKTFLNIHSKDPSKREETLLFFKKLFNISGYNPDQGSDLEKLKQILTMRCMDETYRIHLETLIAERKANQETLDTLLKETDPTNFSQSESEQYQEKKRNLDQLIKREEERFLNLDDKSLVLKSFVIRQNIRSLIKAENGDLCSNRKCVSSQSFSVLALNPQQGRNYVFVTTHFHDTNKHDSNNFFQDPSSGPLFSNMGESLNALGRSDSQSITGLSIEANECDQAFDLEHELSLIGNF